MTKLLIGLLGLALVGTGGLVAAVDSFGGSEPLRTISLPVAGLGTTTGTTTDTATESTPEATTDSTVDDASGSSELSGPCDEPEHANEPRCTGAGNDDRSGRGSRNDEDDDDDHDDDSRDDDDREDDTSGHGSDD